MMTMKREQRRAAGNSTFVDRMVSHMRNYHAETVAALSDRELRSRVRHGIERGRTHGLTWEYSLASFVGHMFEICPEFDKHPAIERVLRDESIEVNRRVDALLGYVTDDEWEEAAKQCDAEAYWRQQL
jgi:hypothetical protein